MKFNYVITSTQEKRHANAKTEEVKTTHLFRANGKRVCRCNIAGLPQEEHEYEELPDDAALCEDSADEYADTMEMLKAWGA